MLNKSSLRLGPIPKVVVVMLIWGVVLLAGGLIQQNSKFGGIDDILILWAVVTLIGAIGQTLAFVTGLGPNNFAWFIALGIAWVFTLVAFKVGGVDFYKDFGAVWYIMLGIGYLFTAVQVDKLFYILAGLHFLVGIMMEISNRFVSEADRKGTIFEFFYKNQPLWMAFFGGGSLIVASIIAYALYARQSNGQNLASGNRAQV